MPEEDFKNLPPEERIKRLKKLEEEKKKEIEDAKKAIKDSEEELSDRRKWIEKVPIPEIATEEVESLGEEGKQLVRHHRSSKDLAEKKVDSDEEDNSEEVKEEDLEGAVEREEIHLPKGEMKPYGMEQEAFGKLNPEYVAQVSYAPAQEAKQILQDIYQDVEKRGYMTQEQHETVQTQVSGLEAKANSGYTPSSEAAMAWSAAQQIGAHLLHQEVKYRSKASKGERVAKDLYTGK